MAAEILNGKELAKEIRAGLALRVERIRGKLGRPPGLAVILVGDDPASAVYVRNKERAATKIGMFSEVVRLPATIGQGDVMAAVDSLNERDEVDAFLVQLPLPDGIDEGAVVERIAPSKDGDGLHPANLGRLVAGRPAPRSCTPSGIMALLDKGGVELKGKRAVVIGRSTIVGKPIALMLLERHATVTLCHSRTQDLPGEVRNADIVVAAVGKPRMVKGDWIKEGAAVIDVGINRLDEKLVGDVDFDAASERAGWITPVPGGVGPLTVAMLMKNAVDFAELKIG
ncbi:MAG: bifunctional methylenetetrahydrofolate dehydrogenase/methenyltetrahydrofolate cyclohydrolase FolD [Myxococcota bacterium]